ncbi:MAG: hypothetical protein J5752_01965 [Clostridiales bacterium]|nr:hypothetical protein [Clostridiales bacterium]
MSLKLSKINRGLVLLIAAVLGVVIYLTIDKIDSGKKIKEVRSLANEIITLSKDSFTFDRDVLGNGSYLDLTEFGAGFPTHVSEEDIGKKIEKLKPYLFEDEVLYKEIADLGFEFAEQAYNSHGCLVKEITSRTPSKIKVNYYNNTASVTIYVHNEIITKESTADSIDSTDVLLFEYTGGRWVLVSYEIY